MNRRGQSLVEATLVLLVFFAFLFAVIDCGMMMYSHEALQERVRSAVRYASVRPYDGTGEQVANLILYDQPTEPQAARAAFLGLTRGNIQVHAAGDLLTVAIVNYRSDFFFAKPVITPRPVIVTAPIMNAAK